MSSLKHVYPVSARIKPFFKGLAKGEPLVEVAREGLTRRGLELRLNSLQTQDR